VVIADVEGECQTQAISECSQISLMPVLVGCQLAIQLNEPASHYW